MSDRKLGFYYFDPVLIYLDKIREAAYTRSTDNRMAPPQDTWVHHHKHGEKCNDKCELFSAKKGDKQ